MTATFWTCLELDCKPTRYVVRSYLKSTGYRVDASPCFCLGLTGGDEDTVELS